jgi:hypothetical protein
MKEWHAALIQHATPAARMEINTVGFVVDRVTLSENKIG